ncbi:hypothetical protein HLB23_28345 [Nocardia uniformis]|uniref:Uncharacterized protein n=1 Tax=Nocardia uniformis TaxID=53432 RepID=A0A849C7K0_9NOCA|nr:hypothetical protein [Nocardia uniformis]NNH73718.1 hypothetical protein [Nocardia uniformis]
MSNTGNPDLGGSEQAGSPTTWTPWRAAHAYAAAMLELSTSGLGGDDGNPADFDVTIMLITYALADYARSEGITVTRPADLADLSIKELWRRLATDPLMASIALASPTDHAVAPAEGDPLHALFHRMKTEVDANGRSHGARGGEQAWYARGEDGQALVGYTLWTYIPPADRDAGRTPLRFLTAKAEGTPDAQDPLPNPPAPQAFQVSEYMAADQLWPERGTGPWAVRVMQGNLGGRMLLMHYMASVDDRDIGVPADLTAPRKPGESADEYAQRQRLSTLYLETHVLAADWSPTVADELMHIRPSDATNAVEAITEVAKGWWTAAGYRGTIDDLVPAMTVLLDGLVAPERRSDVQRVLNVIIEGGGVALDRVRLRLMGAAQGAPFEALHLAAAFTSAMYQNRTCVPDPKTESLRLAQEGMRMAEGKFDKPETSAPASMSPTPAKSAQSADARKKAARKTARKSRRQGRR